MVQQIPEENKHRDSISVSFTQIVDRSQTYSQTVRVSIFRAQIKVSLSSNRPSSIYSKTWTAKFTVSPKVLEYSAVSRSLLMLQTRGLKFLEHSFFAKNVTKSPNVAKKQAKKVAKLLQALSLQSSRKGQISC